MKRDRQLIERFWALRRSVRFSSTETVLYLALVRLCRDAGWPPALLCPNAALCREAGIDESTLVRARHALIRKGLIGYAGTTAGSHRTCYVLSPLPLPDSGAALPACERTGPSATGRDSDGLQRADCGMPDRSVSERGAACPTPAAKRRAGIGRELAGTERTDNARSDRPVHDGGAALPACERTGPSATGRDSDGLLRADCGMPDRSFSEREAACPTPAAKRRAGIGRESAGTERTDNARSDQPVPDSGAAHNGSETWMEMNANRDSAGLRSDRPDESAVGNRARNPHAQGTEAGEPDTPAFAPTDSGSAPATLPIQPRPCGKPQNPGVTARQLGGVKAAHRRIGAGTDVPGAPETGPSGVENSSPRSRRTAVTPPQAGKGAGKEGDYGGDREEERDYPNNRIDHKTRNGWETYRPGNGDVAGEEAGAAILPDLLPDILPDLRAGSRHEKRGDTSLYARPDFRTDVRADTRQGTISDGRATRRPKTGTNDAQPATAPATGRDTAFRAEQADSRVSASGKSAVRKRASAPAVTAKGIPSSNSAQRAAVATAECKNPANETAGRAAKTVATDDLTTPPAGPKATRCGTPPAEVATRPTRCPTQRAAIATAECENPMEVTGGSGSRSEQGISQQKRPEYRAAADGDEELSFDRPTGDATGSTAKRIPHRFAGPKATRCGTQAAEETGCGTVRADDYPIWCAVGEVTHSDNGAAQSDIRSTQTDIRRARAGNRAPQPGNPAACAAGMTVRRADAGRKSVAQADGEPAQAAPAVGVAEVPTKCRRRVRAELDLSFVGQDFLIPFGEWLAYKRGRGNGYRTQASLEACYERLLRLSDDDPARAREVVRQSIANNWSGIFELRQNHANHHPIAPAHAGAVPRTAVPPHTDGYTDTL